MPRHNSRRPRSRRHYDRAYDEDLEEAYDDLDEFDDSCVGRCCKLAEKICCLFVCAGESGERYHGTGHFVRNGHCGSGYNEVMTSWAWWESNLPWAIEAFVYATDGGPDGHFERNRERARGIHRAFLANFGLAPREVPLLFYRCGPGGPDGGQPFTEATAPKGGCFEEDEGD